MTPNPAWPKAPDVIQKKDYRKVQLELEAYLADRFKVVSVQIGDDIHYRGTNVVVTSPAFADLLPEQRFHHVVRAIPPDFYDRHLRRGVVWFELAPGETGKDVMAMPRSEDVAGQEEAIRRQLLSIRFDQALRDDLGKRPADSSIEDFAASRRLLARAGLSESEILRACLFFVRRGAFCDFHVLADLIPKLAARPATADCLVHPHR